ncbi:YggS family pyridoxal phosphate-dependent enzyme [Labedella endophytica]|uniref:Pyridoxal phosphate homeostasis protein n=1 Tax=Labedella endophytica TaxID=1523160 RepID=A0A3S0WY10_9MICO|nr:YggS family pyridoxal phosphate-dependent enzyme [Labedella endophytica]RUR00812.1 YggS family pyridoxal phosphate-dependent enzyme [Labedella endophytica]
MSELEERVAAVRESISRAAVRAGRDPLGITTIAVTKFHPAALVSQLYEAGIRDVGENRQQEAEAKAAELVGLDDLTWHFVGQLQSKKARRVARFAGVIHSVDRDSVIDALAGADRPVSCFVQVALSDDDHRGGAPIADVERLAERIVASDGLSLAGVMAVAPLGAEPRPAFARLRSVSDRIRAIDPLATAISAGMSDDFEDAILEGATHLRIGTAITGKRPATP